MRNCQETFAKSKKPLRTYWYSIFISAYRCIILFSFFFSTMAEESRNVEEQTVEESLVEEDDGVHSENSEVSVHVDHQSMQVDSESETPEAEVCNSCGKERSNENSTNWKRHTEACEKKKEQRTKKLELKKEKKEQKANLKRKSTHGHQKLSKFFKPSCASNSLSSSTQSSSTQSSCSQSSSSQSSSYQSSSSQSLAENIDFERSGISSPEQPSQPDQSEQPSQHDQPSPPKQPSTSQFEEPAETQLSEGEEDQFPTSEADETESSATPSTSHTTDDPVTSQACIQINDKCDGYHPFITNLFTDIPCHLLHEISVVVENGTLHHKRCADKDYALFESVGDVNKVCDDLKHSPNVKKLVERGKKCYTDNKDLHSLNHKYLCHRQLSEKASRLQEEKRLLRLKLMNNQFKNSKLCATISMHNRFLVLIADNKVLRLQQLVKVSLNNGRSIGFIISQVVKAIDGLYRPNPSQDDRELAFLVLKLGGPSLLDILHRAGVLPSDSTAYRMSKKCPPLVSSVQNSVTDCFKANISLTEIGKSSQSLKLDETYNTAVLSYNSKDNQAYGLCYQHGCGVKVEIDEYRDCEKLESMIEKNELHIPKECLVAGLAGLNENTAMQPLLIWPSCSKKDVEGTISLIEEVNEEMKEDTGFPLMNVSTDGDGTRRIAANKLMTHTTDEYEWNTSISGLPLMDYEVGPDGITFNFDPKHMSKRLWRAVISEKMNINGIQITKKLLGEFLDGNSFEVGEHHLYPKDKQNVEAATRFHLAFMEMAKKGNMPYNFMPIKREIGYIAEIMEGLLAFYVYADASITDQIQKMSTASYLLFALYREHRTSFIPAQLYHDLTLSFIDALFCCAKTKYHTPDEPFYLVRDGSDLLERFFGNVRLRFKGSNFSVLEMINAARSMGECDRILIVEHPEWSKNSRVQRRLALDYSNAGCWNKEKLVLRDCNIKGAWRQGYHRALSMLPTDISVEIEDDYNTLRCPVKQGTVVGVDASATDWSIDEEGSASISEPPQEQNENDEAEEVDEVQEVDELFNLAEVLHESTQKVQPFFLIDGKEVYKSTCLKAISSAEKLSKDRLRRVQGMTRYPGTVNADLSHNDALLFVGDPVLVSDPKEGPMLANIVTMKQNNKICSEVDASSGLTDIQFTLSMIEGQEVDGRLFWKGTTTKESFPCTGDRCLPIKPQVEINPPEGMSKYFFDMNLLRDMSVHLQLQPTTSAPSAASSTVAGPSSVLKKKCLVCRKMVDWSSMRCHVAAHILKGEVRVPPGELDRVCGFCSGLNCDTSLKISRKGGKEYSSIDRSDCSYYFDYGKTKKFNKKTNPCTNRFIRCPMKNCVSNIWTYNYEHHHERKHLDEDVPEIMVISEVEKEHLMK